MREQIRIPLLLFFKLARPAVRRRATLQHVGRQISADLYRAFAPT